MKICLIRPPYLSPMSSFTAGAHIPPLGLALLAGNVAQAGHQVSLIDALGEGISQFSKISALNFAVNGLTPEQIIAKIPKDVEVIGVSLMFSVQWFYDEYLIKAIKAKFPHVPIVVGGEHISAEWETVLRLAPWIDYCVIGEGEETFLDLLNALETHRPVSSVPGIAFRENNKVERTGRRTRKKNLEELSTPLWDLIPLANYHQAGYTMTMLNRRSIPMLASRGCPFSCTFCTSPQMWGTELYLRKPESIVAEIKSYVEKYNINHVDFCDLVGVIHKKWLVEVLTLLAQENLKISWIHGAGTRSEILDEEVLDLFKKTGANRIFYAPETGSKTTIKKINKKINLDKMTASMKYAIKLGMSTKAPLIFGFPDQTLKEVFESILFAFKLSWIGVDDVVVHIFSAHPGSKDHEHLVKTGVIPMEKYIQEGDYAEFLLGESHTRISQNHSWSNHIPSWSLKYLQWGTMLGHYIILFTTRPHRLVKSFYRAAWLKLPLTLFDHVIYRVFCGPKFKVNYSELQETKFEMLHSKPFISQPTENISVVNQ